MNRLQPAGRFADPICSVPVDKPTDDHPPSSGCDVLHVLQPLLPIEELGSRGDPESSIFLRLLGSVFSVLVPSHRRVVHPAQNQSTICGDAAQPERQYSCG